MIRTFFAPEARDEQLRFVVIVARSEGKWVFVRHRARETWELPGGHREAGETVEQAARRELWEETGAREFDLKPLFLYGVDRDGERSFGAVFAAQVRDFDSLPEKFEMRERVLAGDAPGEWTYPKIQPLVLAWAREALAKEKDIKL